MTNEGISDGAAYCNRVMDFRRWAVSVGCTVFRPVHLGINGVWSLGVMGVGGVGEELPPGRTGRVLVRRYASVLLHDWLVVSPNEKPKRLSDFSSRFVFYADGVQTDHARQNNSWGRGFHFGLKARTVLENPASLGLGRVLVGALICYDLPHNLEYYGQLCCVTGDCSFDVDRGAISVTKAGVSYVFGASSVAANTSPVVT